MIVFILLISRHGKTRLNKYYKPFNQKDRSTIQREVQPFHYILLHLDQQYDNRSFKSSDPLPRMERLQGRVQKVRNQNN